MLKKPNGTFFSHFSWFEIFIIGKCKEEYINIAAFFKLRANKKMSTKTGATR